MILMTSKSNSPDRLPPAGTTSTSRARVLELPLEYGVLAPATARHAARPVLESWGIGEEEVYDLLVVISELVTNAVTYAQPPIILHLHAAPDTCGRVQVRVSDGGPQTTPTTWAANRPHDEHGRGTHIITTLTTPTPDTTDNPDTLINTWATLDAA